MSKLNLNLSILLASSVFPNKEYQTAAAFCPCQPSKKESNKKG